jgi:hypothetical protein
LNHTISEYHHWKRLWASAPSAYGRWKRPLKSAHIALLALIAEYQRREARANDFGIDDAERDPRAIKRARSANR